MAGRSFTATTGAPKQRCMMRNCSKWEFKQGLCGSCLKADTTGLMATLASRDWDATRNLPPIRTNLVVVSVHDQPHYIELNEGDYVHVIEELPEHGLVIVRTRQEQVGYYAASALKTEQQIYEEFVMEEDVQLILEIENQEEAERQQEAQFEAALKQKMKQKAEQDRIAREEESRRRKEEAERMLEEIEARKAWESAEATKQAEAKRVADAKAAEMRRIRDAQLRKQATAVREADERENQARLNQKAAEYAAWEAQEEARKDKEYLESLPAWKREVVLRKRAQKPA